MLPLILFGAEASLIIEHLIQMDSESKRLRFGYIPSNDAIVKYVTTSFAHKNSAWYGYLIEGKCIGAIHVFVDGDTSEFGISLDINYRGKKLSNALFDRAMIYIKAQGVKTVTMQCLSENAAMKHIARKHGMSVITLGPGENSATVNIEPSNQMFASIEDAKLDMLSLVDANVRNQIWLFKSLNSIFKKE
jgi:hypothetical protein